MTHEVFFLKGVKVIAIDESSMLGRRTFGQIIARLFEIFEDMGISLLLAGDAMQLLPFKQNPLWSKAPLVFEEAEGASAEGATAKPWC